MDKTGWYYVWRISRIAQVIISIGSFALVYFTTGSIILTVIGIIPIVGLVESIIVMAVYGQWVWVTILFLANLLFLFLRCYSINKCKI